MALIDWMPILASKIKEIDGLDGGVRYTPRQDPNEPGLPKGLGEFPVALIIPGVGMELAYSGSAIIAEHTAVTITLYTAQGFLPEAADIAVPFIERIKNKLAINYSLDWTVSHVEPLAPWWGGPGGFEYASQIYTGINFFYQVKEKVSIAISG